MPQWTSWRGTCGQRSGFTRTHLAALTVLDVEKRMDGVQYLTWSQVYRWAKSLPESSTWGPRFTQCLEIAERKLADEEHLRNGTLTTFTGIPFTDDNPWSYGEAKRIIRLMMDRLRDRKDLIGLDMEPGGVGRKAITGKRGEAVWDYLPLASADQDKNFTSNPHLTLALGRTGMSAYVTLPSGTSNRIRRRLVQDGVDGLTSVLRDCMGRMETTLLIAEERAKPNVYLEQKHFKSQRGKPIFDGRMDFDLRTMIDGGQDGVKFQPQWVESLFELLAGKKSNIQLGLGALFPYTKATENESILRLVAESWLSLSPFLRRLEV
jgi:hypothetical protein